jgi:hypothetical protein
MSEQDTNNEVQVQDSPAAEANPNMVIVDTSFHFRSEEVTIVGEDGTSEKLKSKRDSFHTKIPSLTAEGLLAIIAGGGKELDLLLEAANDVIYARARDLINTAISNNKSVVLTDAVFPASSLDWTTIATLPKAERRGAGIAKEVWAAFEEDYVNVMQALYPEKEVVKIANAGAYLGGKFAKVKTNKPVISALTQFLNQWFEATAAKEEFAEVYQFLLNKSETLLATDESVMLNAL